MIVNIRSDYCIALRMIALQEHHRKTQDWYNQASQETMLQKIARLRLEGEQYKEIAVRETMKNATLRAALKPFADCEVWEGYKGYERFVAGMFHIHNKGMDSLNISHIRAARAAYLGEKDD